MENKVDDWKLIMQEQPPEGLSVETKMIDAKGERNQQCLVRKGRIWWFTDFSMYVYYVPTHWRECKHVHF